MGKYLELTGADFEATLSEGVSLVDFGLHGVDLVV